MAHFRRNEDGFELCGNYLGFLAPLMDSLGEFVDLACGIDAGFGCA